MKQKVYIILFVLVVLSLFSFKKNKEKLLIYTTIENTTKLCKTDTNWLNNNVCIELTIDTIFANQILYVYRDKKLFEYHGKTYNKSQLYDLKDLEYIKQLKVNSYEIYVPWIEPPCYKGVGNCISKDHKEILKRYIKNNHHCLKKILIYPKSIIDNNGLIHKEISLNSVILTTPPH